MLLSTPWDFTKRLHFLLDNVHIQVGDHVFQQCIGIPMGTNCAPLLADLLYDYESTAMILFSQGGTSPIPKSFHLTRRYIDDLITINNPRFDSAIGKIDPSTLTLKETNLSDHRVAYLDHQLDIEKSKLVLSLYDKQDDFPFKVQNYPIWIAMSHACLCTGFISACFFVLLVPVIDTRIF